MLSSAIYHILLMLHSYIIVWNRFVIHSYILWYKNKPLAMHSVKIIHCHTQNKIILLLYIIIILHGRVHPNYCQITILLVVDLRWSLVYFMMTHPFPIASKLPIKTLVARQLPTNTHMHNTIWHTYHTYMWMYRLALEICVHVMYTNSSLACVPLVLSTNAHGFIVHVLFFWFVLHPLTCEYLLLSIDKEVHECQFRYF